VSRRRAGAALSAVAAFLAAGLLTVARDAPRVEVAPGEHLQSVVDSAPEGAEVVLLPGTHRGPLVVRRAMTVRGETGAAIAAPADAAAAVTIAADGVVLRGLQVRGGSTGVYVREVEEVTVTDVVVRAADLHGIEVVDAAAHLTGVDVAELNHPMAQAIEIRNSDGRPDSVIEASRTSGGQEGIVSHVAEVVVRDNVVTDTTMRAIAITEMSDGVVTGNVVRDATGSGLYCGDMSRCVFEDNDVATVAAGELGLPNAGWGLVVTYHARASSDGNALSGIEGEVFTSTDGRVVATSPLEIGAGTAALRPLALTLIAALAVLALAMLSVRRIARALERAATGHPAGIEASHGARDRRVEVGAWIAATAVVGMAVQTFHMVEHSLQVYRVHFDGVPSRGGLAGPRVEPEWIHLAYNAVVLVALALIVAARARGWRPRGRVDLGDRLLLVACFVQGYHVVEHTAKVAQHLATGAKVNDGLAGRFVDLVFLHFGINLVVYIALVAAALAYTWGSVRFQARLRRSALPRMSP